MNSKDILNRLGVEKDAEEPQVPKVSEEKKEPIGVDEETIDSRYTGFDRMYNDIANFPDYGHKLLDAIIASEKLFGRFICTEEYLAKIAELCPNKIESIVNNLLTIPKSYSRFLSAFATLSEVATLKAFQPYRGRLLNRALTHPPIYTRLLLGSTDIQRGFNYFPESKTMILDILARDPVIFVKCVKGCKHFCEFSKEHPSHTDQFFHHLISSDSVNDKMILTISQLQFIMEQFPAFQDQLIDFMIADDKRFVRTFPSFMYIYDFCKKYPHYLEKLFAKAISMDSYVRRIVVVVSDLFSIFDKNPEHAKQIESLVIADPKWVLKVLDLPADFKIVCERGDFERLKAAFLNAIYLDTKQFTFLHVSNQAHLDNMIALVPEQTKKLNLYFQLLTQKKPLAQVIHEHQSDPETLAELKLYIMRHVKSGAINAQNIESLREQVASLLNSTKENAPHYAALSDLIASLGFSLTPKVAELLGKSMPKGDKPPEEPADISVAQPVPPGLTNSN